MSNSKLSAFFMLTFIELIFESKMNDRGVPSDGSRWVQRDKVKCGLTVPDADDIC